MVAVCRSAQATLDTAVPGGAALVTVLAHVRDPGNAGTVLRVSDAAGADGVVFTSASVDASNPSACARRRARCSTCPSPRRSHRPRRSPARGRWACRWAAEGATGTSLDQIDEAELARPTAWVFGNEAWGLSPEVLDQCDRAIAVPIYGAAESLNLSTAAAVCLYASARAQRREGGLPPDSVSTGAHPQR